MIVEAVAIACFSCLIGVCLGAMIVHRTVRGLPPVPPIRLGRIKADPPPGEAKATPDGRFGA